MTPKVQEYTISSVMLLDIDKKKSNSHKTADGRGVICTQ